MSQTAPVSKLAKRLRKQLDDKAKWPFSLIFMLVWLPVLSFFIVVGNTGLLILVGAVLAAPFLWWWYNRPGVRSLRQANDFDFQTCRALEPVLVDLQSGYPRAGEQEVAGTVTIEGMRLGEITRHFDSSTNAVIEGWLDHTLGVFGHGLGVQIGRFGVGIGSIGIAGRSDVHLTSRGITRDSLMGDGFIAVLEEHRGSGVVETLRVVVPSEDSCRDYIRSLLESLSIGEDSHTGVLLDRYLSRILSVIRTDISYVSDQLMANARRPLEDRPPIAVAGTPLTDHAMVGGAVKIGTNQRWLQLFPLSIVQQIVGPTAESSPSVKG